MKKFNKKIPILFASFALMMGIGLSGKNGVITSNAEEVSDILTNSNTINENQTSGAYKNIDETGEFASGATYKGHMAGQYNSIQMRSTQTSSTYYSGLVTVKSGGTIKKVIIEWNSNTSTTTGSSARSVNIYFSNEAYSSPNDLYGSSTHAETGNINRNSTEYTPTGNYTHLGIAAKGGALFLDKITIVWDKIEDPTPENEDAFLDAWNALTDVAIEDLTLEHEDLVKKAREEYQKLNDSLKTKEIVQEALKDVIEYEAKIIELKIDAIGEVKDDSKKAQIEAARKAFDDAEPEVQSKVNNLAKLVAAEKALENFAPLDYVFDLTSASFSSSSDKLVTWTNGIITMTNAKGTGTTNANNYLGGDNTTTRFYTGHIFTISLNESYVLRYVEITGNSGYLDGLNGDSKWNNATTSLTGTVLTVTPTANNISEIICNVSTQVRLTSVKVFYALAGVTADAFLEAVGAIPALGDIKATAEHEALISEARSEYNKLDDQLKESAEVKEALAKLEAAESKLYDLLAQEIIDAINGIGRVTASKKELIEKVRKMYDDARPEIQERVRVTNYQTLLDAEEALRKLTPTVTYTLDTAVDKIASNNTYTKHIGVDSNGTSWIVTSGSKQDNGLWLGSSQTQSAKEVLGEGEREEAIAKALGISTSDVGYFGIIQNGEFYGEEDPRDAIIGGINISYYTPDEPGTSDKDTLPEYAYLLISTDNGKTYSVVDAKYLEDDGEALRDGEVHEYIFTQNYAHAQFAIIYKNTIGQNSNTRLKAPKIEFMSHPNESLADSFVNKYMNNTNYENLCGSSEDDIALFKAFVDEYDSLDAEVRAIVSETSIMDTTFAEHMEYVRAYVNHPEEYNNSGSNNPLLFVFTESNTSSLIALFAILGLVAVSAYYFIEKRKYAK